MHVTTQASIPRLPLPLLLLLLLHQFIADGTLWWICSIHDKDDMVTSHPKQSHPIRVNKGFRIWYRYYKTSLIPMAMVWRGFCLANCGKNLHILISCQMNTFY